MKSNKQRERLRKPSPMKLGGISGGDRLEPSEIVAETGESMHGSVLSRVGTEHVWLRVGRARRWVWVLRKER
jgi:hypothetical protein